MRFLALACVVYGICVAAATAAVVTSRYDRVRPGETTVRVRADLGAPEVGPLPYTSPVGLINCYGWEASPTTFLAVCFHGPRVVYVAEATHGTSSKPARILRQKGARSLFVKSN